MLIPRFASLRNCKEVRSIAENALVAALPLSFIFIDFDLHYSPLPICKSETNQLPKIPNRLDTWSFFLVLCSIPQLFNICNNFVRFLTSQKSKVTTTNSSSNDTSTTTPPGNTPGVTKKATFWFGTGGAGFCISKALAKKMLPIAGNGKFASIGYAIHYPDDVTMGFIIEHMLKIPLTVIDQFHSHLEPLEFLRQETFQDQVSFSYFRFKSGKWNVVKIDGFDPKTDPRRFYSIHCHLFPYFSFCPR